MPPRLQNFLGRTLRNQNLTKIERRILHLCDGFRKTDPGIDLIANAFPASISNIRILSIFCSFLFCSIIYLFEKRNGAYSCLPLFKGWFHLWSFYSVQNASCSFKCTIFLLIRAPSLIVASHSEKPLNHDNIMKIC